MISIFIGIQITCITIMIICCVALIPSTHFIDWSTHLDMTKKEPNKKATFKEFKKEFESHDMKKSKSFNRSFFSNDLRCECHASLYSFNGTFMRFGYFQYIKVIKYLKKIKIEDMEYHKFL